MSRVKRNITLALERRWKYIEYFLLVSTIMLVDTWKRQLINEKKNLFRSYNYICMFRKIKQEFHFINLTEMFSKLKTLLLL